MAVRNSIAAIPLASIDTATYTGAYQLLTPASGLANACFILRIVNNSDRITTISYDGVTDNDIIPTAAHFELNPQSNSQPNNFTCLFARGLKVYVKGLAGGTGLVYLAGYYQVVAN
jgi:hypothetical protein